MFHFENRDVFYPGNRQFNAHPSDRISIQEGRNLDLHWRYKLQSNQKPEEMSFGICNRRGGIISKKLLTMKATDKVNVEQGQLLFHINKQLVKKELVLGKVKNGEGRPKLK